MRSCFRWIALSILAPAFAQVPSLDVQRKIAPIFEQGRAAERGGNFEQALAYYEQALSLGPGVAEIWANKGLMLHRLDRPAEALKSFLEASRLKPQLSTPALFAGIEYLQLGQPGRALAPLRTALRLEPHNDQARFELSRAHHQLGQFSEAVALLQELVERDPKADRYWYRLGTAYLRWCSESVRILTDGESGYGAMLRAEMSAGAGKLEVAQSRYKAAAALLGAAAAEIPLDPATVRMPPGSSVTAPSSVPPARTMDAAVAAWRAGKHTQSLRLIETVLKDSPRNPRALYWLTLNTRALASESLLHAVESDPTSWRAHWMLAETAARQNDPQTALKEYQDAVAAGPQEAEPRVSQVQYLASIDRLAEAEQSAREGLRVFPSNTDLHFELARILLQSGQSKDALSHLQEAATDPANPAARRDLANTYAELGDLRHVIDALLPVLASDLDGSLHYRIARWYRETGQMEKSRAALAETTRLKTRKIQQDQQFLK